MLEDYTISHSFIDRKIFWKNYMEDVVTLSISNKEEDFVKSGTDIDLEVFADVLETFTEIPYVGSLIKLGRLANRYQDLHFIRK